MLPKVLKKGLLCLAFAGAIGGLAGCNNGPKDFPWDISPAKLTPHQRDVRSSAIEAELYQVRTENFKRALKAHLVTQKAADEGIKYDEDQIVGRRQAYVNTVDLPFWEGFFKNEMKKQGWVVRDKFPELPRAPVSAKPGAPRS